MRIPAALARASVAAIAALVGIGVAAFPAAVGAPLDETEPCFDEVQIRWVSTVHLYSNATDVERDEKELTHDGDVSVDGWTSGVPSGDEGVGVDGWGADGKGNFRTVIGTVVPLTDVQAEVTVENATIENVGTPYTPAGGATPDKYKQLLVDPLPDTAGATPTTISWMIGAMPANGPEEGSSLGVDFTAIPDDPDDPETPITVTLVVTGTATVEVDCPTPTPTPTPTDPEETPTETPTETATPIPTPTSTTPGGLPSTGAQNVGALFGAAAVLLVVGAIAVGLGRRRRGGE